MTVAELFLFIPVLLALLGFMAGRWQNPMFVGFPMEVWFFGLFAGVATVVGPLTRSGQICAVASAVIAGALTYKFAAGTPARWEHIKRLVTARQDTAAMVEWFRGRTAEATGVVWMVPAVVVDRSIICAGSSATSYALAIEGEFPFEFFETLRTLNKDAPMSQVHEVSARQLLSEIQANPPNEVFAAARMPNGQWISICNSGVTAEIAERLVQSGRGNPLAVRHAMQRARLIELFTRVSPDESGLYFRGDGSDGPFPLFVTSATDVENNLKRSAGRG